MQALIEEDDTATAFHQLMRKEDGTVNEVEPEEVLNAVHPVRERNMRLFF